MPDAVGTINLFFARQIRCSKTCFSLGISLRVFGGFFRTALSSYRISFASRSRPRALSRPPSVTLRLIKCAAEEHLEHGGRRDGASEARLSGNRPLVGFPIARLRGIAPWAIAAAHIFRLRLLDSRNIWPRHASIAPLIRSMILAIGHDVFSAVGIVL